MAPTLLFLVNDAAFFLAYSLPLARAAADAGYAVHVATPEDEHVRHILRAGLTWHPVRIFRSRLNLWLEVRSFVDILRLYRRVRPDLVYQVTQKPVLYGTMAARFAGVPRVVNHVAGLGYMHGDDAPRVTRAVANTVCRIGLRQPCMRVIFENDDDCVVYVERGWITTGQSILIRGVGVDMSVFVPKPPVRSSTTTVILASRLIFPKGVAEFVEAARRLKRQGDGVRMIVVGEPDPSNPSSIPESRIRSWTDEGIIEYWGRREDMPAVLAAADIVCLPTYYREGMPRVLIEAAACGRPAITTDMPGCRDIVVDGTTGLLVAPRDVDGLVRAIERLAADPGLRATLGLAAREHAVRHFSLDVVLASTLAVFDELLRHDPNSAMVH